jgi:hypothetical protein
VSSDWKLEALFWHSGMVARSTVLGGSAGESFCNVLAGFRNVFEKVPSGFHQISIKFHQVPSSSSSGSGRIWNRFSAWFEERFNKS